MRNHTSDGLPYEKHADGKSGTRCLESEIPFEIPKGWSWTRLGQLVATCGGKTPSKANKAFWEGGGVPWITSKDMKVPELFGSQSELTESGASETNLVPAGSAHGRQKRHPSSYASSRHQSSRDDHQPRPEGYDAVQPRTQRLAFHLLQSLG